MSWRKPLSMAALLAFMIFLFSDPSAKPPYDLSWAEAIILLMGAPVLAILFGVCLSVILHLLFSSGRGDRA